MLRTLLNWFRPSTSEAARRLARVGAEKRAADERARKIETTNAMRKRNGQPEWSWK